MTASASRCAPSLQIELPDPGATARLAQKLAAVARAGDVIALIGDLGSGKTSFARAYINALPGSGSEEDVPSPTFTLVQSYERAPAEVWHFDLYRVNRPDEAFELGIEEALAEGITLIEWPERLGPLLPAVRLEIAFSFADEPDARHAVLTGYGSWAGRLSGLDLGLGYGDD